MCIHTLITGLSVTHPRPRRNGVRSRRHRQSSCAHGDCLFLLEQQRQRTRSSRWHAHFQLHRILCLKIFITIKCVRWSVGAVRCGSYVVKRTGLSRERARECGHARACVCVFNLTVMRCALSFCCILCDVCVPLIKCCCVMFDVRDGGGNHTHTHTCYNNIYLFEPGARHDWQICGWCTSANAMQSSCRA